MDLLRHSAEILVALFLVLLNGFFVAAEFALVKVRPSQLTELAQEGRAFARTAVWLSDRLDSSLSACQMGITMASLALGWVGEPAFGHLIKPLFEAMGLDPDGQLLHGLSFGIAFSTITALHLVIGEQAPKIFAIRRPEVMALWCAVPLLFFFVVLYPFLILLNQSTSMLLRWLGLEGGSEHDTPHSEDEIRALLSEAHLHGNLTRSEHHLLNAVFEFDDMVCRRVMVPRCDVEFFDVNQPLSDCLTIARRTKHTRYPVCNGSLDDALGVVHMKDLIGIAPDDPEFELKQVMRPPKKVPETMPISALLRHFQATHQLLAFVIDEYGTVTGIVTLENVLEEIVGPVEDEFDAEEPNIVAVSPGQFLVHGSTPVQEVERRLDLELDEMDVDTISGVLTTRLKKLPTVGAQIKFPGAVAEIEEVRDGRAIRIRFKLDNAPKETS